MKSSGLLDQTGSPSLRMDQQVLGAEMNYPGLFLATFVTK